MGFDFTRGRQTITSPMPYYFTNRYVQLNALLVGGVQLDRQPVDYYIAEALETARERGNLGALLAPLNIKYVLMPLNMASANFRFVEGQKDLEVVERWSDLVLLRNKVPVSHLTVARSTGSYTTFSAVGKQASDGNLLGSFLPRGARTVIPMATGTPLPHRDSRTGKVTADLPRDRGRTSWLLFSEPFSADWRASAGGAARKQLGVLNAFRLPEGVAGKITISYFNLFLLLGYSLSAAGLLLCLLFVTGEAIAGSRKKNDREGAG
jgi:hypothetical protein